jgi:hypothetical protein
MYYLGFFKCTCNLGTRLRTSFDRLVQMQLLLKMEEIRNIMYDLTDRMCTCRILGTKMLIAQK